MLLSESEDIVDRCNDIVFKYALSERERLNKRAKICRCGGCKQQAIDGEDLLNWAAGTGRWALSPRKERRARKEVSDFSPENGEDCTDLATT